MSDVTVKLGQEVPDFDLTTYEPSKGDFGKFSLAEQKKAGRWTILNVLWELRR